METLQFKMM